MANLTRNSTNSTCRSQHNLSHEEYISLSLYIAIVGVLGVLGNSLVIHSFRTFKNLRTSTNTFVCHLSVCSLFLAVLDLTFSLPSVISHRWIYGSTMCNIYGWFYNFFCAMSLTTLAAISLDRYWVIAKPSIGVKITISRAILFIFLTYIYTFLPTTPIFFSSDFFQEDVFHTGCYLDLRKQNTASLLYAIFYAVFLFALPFATMVICYYLIYASVYQRRQCYSAKSTKRKRAVKLIFRSAPHLRTVRMIVLAVAMFLSCWLPYVAVSLVMTHGNHLQVSTLTLEITILLAKSAVVYNPLVYAVLNQRFRKVFFEFLCCEKTVKKRSQCDKGTTSVTNPESHCPNACGLKTRKRKFCLSKNAREQAHSTVRDSISTRGYSYSASPTPTSCLSIGRKQYNVDRSYRRSFRSADTTNNTTPQEQENILEEHGTHLQISTHARFMDNASSMDEAHQTPCECPEVLVHNESSNESALCEHTCSTARNVTPHYQELRFSDFTQVQYKSPVYRTRSVPVKTAEPELDTEGIRFTWRRGSVFS